MSPNFARCQECTQRITFYGSPFTGDPRAFDPKDVDARTYQGVAFPVMSGRAYRFGDLVDRLWPQRETSRVDVEMEVRDLPWYVLHQCVPTTTPERSTG